MNVFKKITYTRIAMLSIQRQSLLVYNNFLQIILSTFNNLHAKPLAL